MRRPSYSAVTGVVTTLAGVCAVRLALQDLIPPPHLDVSALGPGEYAERARGQDVDWKPLNAETLREAQTRARPLLVVVGVPWSAAARRADETFSSPDVARALNRGFVAVRVDASQEPHWLSAVLPLRRASAGLDGGYQAWVFDLKGRLLDSVAGDGVGAKPSGTLDALFATQNVFAKAALSDDPPTLEGVQRAESDRLVQPAFPSLLLPDAAPALVAALDPRGGDWGARSLFPSHPLALRFLQLAGATDAAGGALRRAVLSPRADWLDGGFYRLARADLGTPEYDKPTVVNAQMAEAMAAQDALRPDPLLRRRAEATVAWLLALREDDLVPAAEQGDEDERGRSARASFSPAHLRRAVTSGVLAAADHDWAVGALGLDGTARLVAPTLAVLDDPRFGRTLDALRRAAGPARRRVATGLCDVNGTVAACLLRCARLWNDRGLAEEAGAIVDRLEPFARGPYLRHALNDPQGARPYLGDALAYADAELEDFLTNGRIPSLDRGAAALRAAVARFGGPEPGVLRPSPTGASFLTGQPEVPQVADDEREALSATALRLLDAYATVLGPSGKDFATAAAEVASRLAAVAAPVPAMGGVLGALARHADPRALFVVGRDAATTAVRLAPRLPGRLVVPILGSARPDLAGRSPGVYVATPTGLAGPLSEAAALARLPSALMVGG